MTITTRQPAKKDDTPKSPRGRKPLLTKEVEEEYMKALRLGLSQARSAKWAGISLNTVKNWLARGESALPVPAGKRSAFDQACVEFLIAHDKAATEWLVRSETIFNLAQSPGTSSDAWARASIEERRLAFETAKFKATHLAPDEYSTKTRSELSGPDGGPIEIDDQQADMAARALTAALAVVPKQYREAARSKLIESLKGTE